MNDGFHGRQKPPCYKLHTRHYEYYTIDSAKAVPLSSSHILFIIEANYSQQLTISNGYHFTIMLSKSQLIITIFACTTVPIVLTASCANQFHSTDYIWMVEVNLRLCKNISVI